MWAIGFALLAFLAASYFALMRDARQGHQAAWPVFLFTGVVIVCAIFWGYLLAADI
jgi:hypothetical protein